MDIYKILELVLIPVMALIGLYAGLQWGIVKGKSALVKAFMDSIVDAAADNTFTAEELKKIKETFLAIFS